MLLTQTHFHNTMVRAVIPEYYRLGDFKKQDIFLKFWRLRSEIQVPTGLVSNVLSWWLEGGCFLCMSSHGLFFAWRKRSVMSFLLSIRMASISGQGPTLSLNIGTLPVSVLLCPTLCHPMDCSPPGSSVYGVFQARILEWVPVSSCRGSFWPRDWNCSSCFCTSCFGRWIL